MPKLLFAVFPSCFFLIPTWKDLQHQFLGFYDRKLQVEVKPLDNTSILGFFFVVAHC